MKALAVFFFYCVHITESCILTHASTTKRRAPTCEQASHSPAMQLQGAMHMFPSFSARNHVFSGVSLAYSHHNNKFFRSSYWFTEYCADPTRDEKILRVHDFIRFLLLGNPLGLEHQIIHNVRMFHSRIIHEILATLLLFLTYMDQIQR